MDLGPERRPRARRAAAADAAPEPRPRRARPKAAASLEAPAELRRPSVSVILPVRNEEGFIGRCIEALAAQDYPRDRFEVVVVDGASTDGTLREARAAARAAGLALRIETNPRRTTAAGFNLGLERTAGEVVIKVDGHTRVAPDFISMNLKALMERGADAVGGPIRTLGAGSVGEAIALAMSSPFGVGGTAFRHSQREQWTDSVPFGAYRREVFERVGRFAEDIDRGEDDEFNYRLVDAGGRILLTPGVRSEYYTRGSLGSLWRQYWGYGLAKASVLGRHPRRLRPRHLVPPAFVLSLAGGTLLGALDRRFLRLAGAAAAAYAVANALASWRILRRQDAAGGAAVLPLAFATIHVAAGTGFLAGMARGLGRRIRNAPRA